MRTTLTASLLVASLSSFTASSQPPNGEALFTQHCAACHLNPVDDDTPTRAAMGSLAPNAIVESLTEGTMRLQGQALSPSERVAIAELVTGRPVLAATAQMDGEHAVRRHELRRCLERLGPRRA
jgi:mono/diheme cytochrome c family protein